MTAQEFLRILDEEDRLGITQSEMMRIVASVSASIGDRPIGSLSPAATKDLFLLLSSLEGLPSPDKKVNRATAPFKLGEN